MSEAGTGLPDKGGTTHMCIECGKMFKTVQRLGAHRARTHGYRNEARAAKGKPSNGAPPELTPDKREIVDRMYEVTGVLYDDRSYSDKLEEFLPALAQEAQRRGDDSLTEAFFTLYLDAR